MKNIIFIAPPAAGKGTQAELLSKYYHIPHISIGDVMRKSRNPNTETGRIIIECQNERKLVPIDVVMYSIKKRLSEKDCSNGYILDGFPRNMEQAKEYEKILKELNEDITNVIYLDIDETLALKRTLNRIICPKCGTTYNMKNEERKPKKNNICDKCGNKLEVRTDDNKETFVKGYRTYIQETLPLIKYYEGKYELIRIKVSEDKTIDDIFSEIKESIINCQK